MEKGLTFLPCELIDDNGKKLKGLVQKYAVEWNLGYEFLTWVDESCFFANTLVDRIVAGYPYSDSEKLHNELGYCDELLDTSELFFFWAIEGPPELREKLPFDKAGLNVIFSDDITPYRLRKVRLLNGAHSCIAPVALLCGVATVGGAVSDEMLRRLIKCALFNEIIPSLDLNKNVLESFANSVIERFSNPFINHELQSIMLNCVSKIEARLLPIIADYTQIYGRFPPILIFAISAYVEFYKKEISKVNEIFSLLSVELENAVCEAHCAIGANGIESEILRLINDKN
jgi:tagaturonate reductase